MESHHLITHGGLGEPEEVRSLCLQDLTAETEELLKQAGCTIVRMKGRTHILIQYPAGTTRQELPFRNWESRFRVQLPTGLALREVSSRDRGCVDLSVFADTIPQRAAAEEHAP